MSTENEKFKNGEDKPLSKEELLEIQRKKNYHDYVKEYGLTVKKMQIMKAEEKKEGSKWTYRELFDAAMRILNANNSSIVALQGERDQLAGELLLRLEQLQYADTAFLNQKEIAQNSLTEQNKIKADYNAKIALYQEAIMKWKVRAEEAERKYKSAIEEIAKM